jgi:hypothetical protein
VGKRSGGQRYAVVQEWSMAALDPAQRGLLLDGLRELGMGSVTSGEATPEVDGVRVPTADLTIAFQSQAPEDDPVHARETMVGLVCDVCDRLTVPRPVLGLSVEVGLGKGAQRGTYRLAGWEDLPIPARVRRPEVRLLVAPPRDELGDDPGLAGVREPRRPKPHGPPPMVAARELPAS